MHNHQRISYRFFLDRGAAMVEAAIVLPLFLVLLVVFIDLVRVIGQHVEIREAHYAAGRFGAYQGESCDSAAQSAFENKLTNLQLRDKLVVLPSPTPTPSISDTGVPGLFFRVRVRSECIMCALFPGLSEKLDYSSSGFFPYENGSCS